MEEKSKNKIYHYIDRACLIWWFVQILLNTFLLPTTGLLTSIAVIIIILMLFYKKSIPFLFKQIVLSIFLEIFIICGVLIYLSINIEPQYLWITIFTKCSFFINTTIITYYLLRLSLLNRTHSNSDRSSNKKHRYVKTTILLWWGCQIISLITLLNIIGIFFSIAILILLILYYSKKIPFFVKELILYIYIISLTLSAIMIYYITSMSPINSWLGYILTYSPFINVFILFYYLFTLKRL